MVVETILFLKFRSGKHITQLLNATHFLVYLLNLCSVPQREHGVSVLRVGLRHGGGARGGAAGAGLQLQGGGATVQGYAVPGTGSRGRKEEPLRPVSIGMFFIKSFISHNLIEKIAMYTHTIDKLI